MKQVCRPCIFTGNNMKYLGLELHFKNSATYTKHLLFFLSHMQFEVLFIMYCLTIFHNILLKKYDILNMISRTTMAMFL